MNEQFILKGKTGKVWFYSKLNQFSKFLNEISTKKIKQHEDKQVDIMNVNFPSPFSMLIKYKVLNTGDIHEIIIQGHFVDAYKKWSESGEIPNNISLIIESEHKNSYKRNELKQ